MIKNAANTGVDGYRFNAGLRVDIVEYQEAPINAEKSFLPSFPFDNFQEKYRAWEHLFGFFASRASGGKNCCGVVWKDLFPLLINLSQLQVFIFKNTIDISDLSSINRGNSDFVCSIERNIKATTERPFHKIAAGRSEGGV